MKLSIVFHRRIELLLVSSYVCFTFMNQERHCCTCFLDLTSWNPSCCLRLFPTDPSLSAWCLTPCWLTTLEAVMLIYLAMERKARGPTSMTAFFNLLKQAVTRQYCSWNYIIGRCNSLEDALLTQARSQHLMYATFLQIYPWILVLDGGSEQPEGLFNPWVAPAGPELPPSACSEDLKRLQALLLPSKSDQPRIGHWRIERHRDRHAQDGEEWCGHEEVNGGCNSRPLPGCQGQCHRSDNKPFFYIGGVVAVSTLGLGGCGCHPRLGHKRL